MNSKKYCVIYLLLISGFFWINVVLWYGFTKQFFVAAGAHGDLTRLSFLPHVDSQTSAVNYTKSHVRFRDYISGEKPEIDVLTLGDSFSNGGGGSYYQDYVVCNYGKQVLNISMMEDDNPLTVLERLLDTGIIQEIHPQVVVLESAERYAAKRFGGGDKTSKKMQKEEFINYFRYNNNNNNNPGVETIFPGIMIKANLQMADGVVKKLTTDNRLSQVVSKEILGEKLFTDKGRENMLVFLNEDLWFEYNNVDCSQINHNLEEVAKELRKYDIQLVVMINVDKFDLYQPFIANQSRNRENTFMEQLSSYESDAYVFINTKGILRDMLKSGETDVYWQDDTHWSWKAQQRVVDVLMNKVKFN